MIRVARWVLRSLWIAGATALVVVALRTVMGPARVERLYRQDEVKRFHPTGGHGLGQLAGETFLVVLCAWGARRWLRVKL